MESQTPPPSSTPETPSISTEINSPHVPLVVEKKQSHVKMFFLGILVTVVIIALLGAGYYLGQQKTEKKTITAVEPTAQILSTTPNPTTATAARSSVPLTEDTVSFTRKDGIVYLRYRNKIYQEQTADAIEPKIMDLPDAASMTWTGLINAPKGAAGKGFDEVFSLKSIPGTEDFLFVTRWMALNTDDKYLEIRPVFYYKAASATVEKINMATEKFPRIKSISEKNNVEFLIFECWNCGGHQPSTELVNLKGNYAKNIGRTSYFAWKDGGNYEYKEYVVIPCPTGTETMGECSEKPEDLPLKTGKL
jgi:hypothetical protein